MTPHEIQERQRAARQRLRAQRLRAGMLRGRVVVVSLIAFVVLWGIVFVQMATGNDPVLGDSSSTLASSQRTNSREGETLATESGAGTNAEESVATELLETSEPEEFEAEELQAEEFEAEPVEEEFFIPEEELAPVTTSQS